MNVERKQEGILFLRRDKPSKIFSRKISDFFRKSDKEDYKNPQTEFVSYGDNSFHERNSDSEMNDEGENARMQKLQDFLWKSTANNDRQSLIQALHRGADVTRVEGDNHRTVLHEAARRGHHKTCELLVRAGSDPNVPDGEGFLPLHLAIKFGRTEAVKSLLRYCSSIIAENQYGDAAIHVASRFNRKSLIPIILEKPLSIPLNHLRDEPSDEFRSKSAPDLKSLRGQMSPINEAFRRERVTFQDGSLTSSASSLPSYDSRVDIEYESRYKSVDLQNSNGDTALHIASALNHKSTVKKLLQYGASTDIFNNQGLKPLDVASSKNHRGVLRLFRDPPKVTMLFTDSYSNDARVGHRQLLSLPRGAILKKDRKAVTDIRSYKAPRTSVYSSSEDGRSFVHRSTSPMSYTSSSDDISIEERPLSKAGERKSTLSLDERIRQSLYGNSRISSRNDYLDEKDRDYSYTTRTPSWKKFKRDGDHKTFEFHSQPNSVYSRKEETKEPSTSKASEIICSLLTEKKDKTSYERKEYRSDKDRRDNVKGSSFLSSYTYGINTGKEPEETPLKHCCCRDKLGGFRQSTGPKYSPVVPMPNVKVEGQNTCCCCCRCFDFHSDHVEKGKSPIPPPPPTFSNSNIVIESQLSSTKKVRVSSSSSKSSSTSKNEELSSRANKYSNGLNDRLNCLGESIKDKLKELQDKYKELESQENTIRKYMEEEEVTRKGKESGVIVDVDEAIRKDQAGKSSESLNGNYRIQEGHGEDEGDPRNLLVRETVITRKMENINGVTRESQERSSFESRVAPRIKEIQERLRRSHIQDSLGIK